MISRKHQVSDIVMQVTLAVLLALALKSAYDAHQLSDRVKELTYKGNVAIVANCHTESIRRLDLVAVIRHLDHLNVGDPKLSRALATYFLDLEAATPTKKECSTLAVKLGVKK